MVTRWSVCCALGAAALLPCASRAQPFTRTRASTLQLPATAPVRGFTTQRVFSALTFDQPIEIVSPPRESNRLFIVEKTGRIMLVRDQAQPAATVFLDLRAAIGDASGERGLLGLAFHPNFAGNGYFYVWYTTETTTSAGTGLHDRLARFTVSADDPDVADPDSEEPLITQFDESPVHNGGGLAFGPDGYLYVGVGDEGGAEGAAQNGQRIDRDFFSGVLRLDVDRRPGSLEPHAHPAVHAGTYAIPHDNPWVSAARFNGSAVNAAAVRTEFWAVGLRNPRRLSFDPSSGVLWAADAGHGVREEIDLVSRGGNYGWPYRDGAAAGPAAPAPAGLALTDPAFEFASTGGLAVTGGLGYRDVQLSQLEGEYVFADAVTGEIRSLHRDLEGTTHVVSLMEDPGISAFAMNPRDGTILLADAEEGVLKQLTYDSSVVGDPFPETLSGTGAFSSLAPLTPQPGLVHYTPNVTFWSDYAVKNRWVALQDDTSTFGFSADGNWRMPVGAVWVKQFDLELTRGDPSTARHVETRFLVRTQDGVYGLSYRWNDAQTDATLVGESGASQSFTIDDAGQTHTQSWRFPSRSECFACHNAESGFALSFNTRQLNRVHDYGGTSANQVTALAQAGYLDSTPPDPATLPALVDPHDTGAALDRRARSYLDANCSQCHRPGGATLGHWDARSITPLSLARIVNGTLTTQGNDPANRVVVPGDAAHSRIYQRMTATGGATRMPPIATREFDHAGEELISAWIDALATPLPDSRIVNLSGRALVGAGDDVLIPGFVVQGRAPRQVLIRAVGPALEAYNLSGLLPAPRLRLFSGADVLGTNAGWGSAANAGAIASAAARVGAFALPEGSADSAMLVTLDPGAYTAVIDDVAGKTGIALFEVYDADDTAGVRLVNTSVRAQVGSGSGVIIPGLVVSPGAFKKVLIRAVGPGLGPLGVEDYQAAPVVTLFAGSEAYLSNQGWGSAPDPQAISDATAAVGAYPLERDSADSAILAELSPGAYTLQVSSGNNTSGVALVEVYEVP